MGRLNKTKRKITAVRNEQVARIVGRYKDRGGSKKKLIFKKFGCISRIYQILSAQYATRRFAFIFFVGCYNQYSIDAH